MYCNHFLDVLQETSNVLYCNFFKQSHDSYVYRNLRSSTKNILGRTFKSQILKDVVKLYFIR